MSRRDEEKDGKVVATSRFISLMSLNCFVIALIGATPFMKASYKLSDWHIPRVFWWNMILLGFLGISFGSLIVHCIANSLAKHR